jgi:hypothetical protein
LDALEAYVRDLVTGLALLERDEVLVNARLLEYSTFRTLYELHTGVSSTSIASSSSLSLLTLEGQTQGAWNEKKTRQ